MLLGVKDLFQQKAVLFVASDFKINPGGSYRLYLNDTAVPSVFPSNTSGKKSQIEQNIEQNSPIREIIDTNNLLLTTPSKVTQEGLYFLLNQKVNIQVNL